jgi:D-cysteine desulfhydrase
MPAKAVASATGVVLDPVYSGKALHALLAELSASPGAWRGRTVVFVHTGGLLGMYDKAQQLQPLVAGEGPPVRRLLQAGGAAA